MLKTIQYIKRRLNERSTWVAIGAGCAGAASLATPFSWIAFAVGIIGALVPDGSVTDDVRPSNH